MLTTILLISILIFMTGTGILFSYIDLRIQRRKRREELHKRLRSVRRYW